MICGADNWVAIEEFGLAKEGWLTGLLGLEHGIPSHGSFGEVYAAEAPYRQIKSQWALTNVNSFWPFVGNINTRRHSFYPRRRT